MHLPVEMRDEIVSRHCGEYRRGQGKYYNRNKRFAGICIHGKILYAKKTVLRLVPLKNFFQAFILQRTVFVSVLRAAR
jgi:hypothetical protein